VEAAVRLVGNCLLEKDLGTDSAIIRSIDAFWDNPTGGADPNVVLDSLKKIKLVEQRPMWEQQITRWTRRFGPTGGGGNSTAGSG
jgi:hypothetical protein